MHNSDADQEAEFPRIGKAFHSFYEDGPFRTCVDCSMPLAEVEQYVIQKVLKRGEVIFEFALCHACELRLAQQVSDESRQRMNQFMEQNLHEADGIEQCTVCLAPRSQLEEFAISGMCADAYLLNQMCMCQDCMAEVQELISDQTRRRWDDFVGRNFPGVPDEQKRPLLL